MTEKDRSDININDYLTNGHVLKASQQAVLCSCYLFVKAPPEPKIAVETVSTNELSENEKRVRLNFKALLGEAGHIDIYRPMVRNEN